MVKPTMEKCVSVDAVIRSLDKMRTIYPFKDEKTAFGMVGNPVRCGDTIVSIMTVDEETGVKVMLEKDATEEMQKGE